MKVTLVMVSSVDGITSRAPGEAVSTWSSLEDQKHFQELVKKYDAVITGSKSFHKKIANIPYFIYSRTRKSTNDELKNKVFFTSLPPAELLSNLPKEIENVLLLGGEEINTLFLRENLVNQLVLTVEPKLFGSGKHLLSDIIIKNLRLVGVKKLNPQGTLILTYEVI